MGKSKGSRKNEISFSDSPPVSIGFMEHEILSHSKYLRVPEVADVGGQIHHQIDFKTGFWYPVGVLDSEKRPCKIVGKVMTMEVSWLTPLKKLETQDWPGEPMSNVFWFKALEFNICGDFTIKFKFLNHSDKSIKPLVCHVHVSRGGIT
jgi:hypothetical protein